MLRIFILFSVFLPNMTTADQRDPFIYQIQSTSRTFTEKPFIGTQSENLTNLDIYNLYTSTEIPQPIIIESNAKPEPMKPDLAGKPYVLDENAVTDKGDSYATVTIDEKPRKVVNLPQYYENPDIKSANEQFFVPDSRPKQHYESQISNLIEKPINDFNFPMYPEKPDNAPVKEHYFYPDNSLNLQYESRVPKLTEKPTRFMKLPFLFEKPVNAPLKEHYFYPDNSPNLQYELQVPKHTEKPTRFMKLPFFFDKPDNAPVKKHYFYPDNSPNLQYELQVPKLTEKPTRFMKLPFFFEKRDNAAVNKHYLSPDHRPKQHYGLHVSKLSAKPINDLNLPTYPEKLNNEPVNGHYFFPDDNPKQYELYSPNLTEKPIEDLNLSMDPEKIDMKPMNEHNFFTHNRPHDKVQLQQFTETPANKENTQALYYQKLKQLQDLQLPITKETEKQTFPAYDRPEFNEFKLPVLTERPVNNLIMNQPLYYEYDNPGLNDPQSVYTETPVHKLFNPYARPGQSYKLDLPLTELPFHNALNKENLIKDKLVSLIISSKKDLERHVKDLQQIHDSFKTGTMYKIGYLTSLINKRNDSLSKIYQNVQNNHHKWDSLRVLGTYEEVKAKSELIQDLLRVMLSFVKAKQLSEGDQIPKGPGERAEHQTAISWSYYDDTMP